MHRKSLLIITSLFKSCHRANWDRLSIKTWFVGSTLKHYIIIVVFVCFSIPITLNIVYKLRVFKIIYIQNSDILNDFYIT